MATRKEQLWHNAEFLVRGKNACNILLYQMLGLFVTITTKIGALVYDGVELNLRLILLLVLVLGLYLVIVYVRYWIWNNNSTKVK